MRRERRPGTISVENEIEAERSEAVAILRERFARGEIDEEAIERRAAVLGRED